jgi:glycosyltransferase involved in cell wall biosynthesis
MHAYDIVATGMRILLVTPLFFPSLSGASVYFDTLSQAIVRRQPTARVVILTRALAGAARRERRGAVQVLRLLPAAGPPGTLRGGRIGAALTALTILLVSLALRSDVVHYHTLASYRGLHRLAPLFRAPLVGDMRDLAVQHEGASLAYYRHCRKLICAAQNIREFLLARGLPAPWVVHIPIPFAPPVPAPPARVATARARYGIAPDTAYALFVGAIMPAKGVVELLAGMRLVWRRLPALHLVLAGPLTPDGDALFAGGFRTHVSGESRLHYLGPVPHEDIGLLLQDADLFILPSRSEGLPRSGLEAIALGRSAILPPGVPEFVAACPEAVLDAITPEAIAAKIEQTWRAGRPPTYPLDRHDPDRIAALTLEVYRSVAR